MLTVDALDPEFQRFLRELEDSAQYWAMRAIERELPRFLARLDPATDALRTNGERSVVHFRWSGWFGAASTTEIHILLEVDMTRGRQGHVTAFHGRLADRKSDGRRLQRDLATLSERRLGLRS